MIDERCEVGRDLLLDHSKYNSHSLNTAKVCQLIADGKQVILVTSGAIGLGRQRLMQQAILSASLRKSLSFTFTST